MAEGYQRSKTMYPMFSRKELELIEALESGNIDNVELACLKRGIDVNELYAGKSPLTIASFKGHLAGVKVLLDNGARINEPDKNGDTPLLASCTLGHSDVAVELIKRGADVNVKDKVGQSPLYVASSLGHLAVVKVLLGNEAKIEKLGKDGATPLLPSCGRGHSGVVVELIKNGADVNKATEDGSTPLMFASKFNHSNIINILIKNGADVNAKNQQGRTALHFAVTRNHKEAIMILLQNRADPNTTDVDGKTALDLAKDREIKDILKEKAEENGFVKHLEKNREKCHEEIAHLRREKEKLLRAQSRVEKTILSRLDQLAESVKDIPPKLIRNEFNYHTNIKNKNYNYGEKAGYQLMNLEQSKLAGELSSEVGEGVVHLTIRIAQLESDMRVIEREIAKLKNCKKDSRAKETNGEKRIDRLTAEKAAQTVALRKTKDLLEKTVQTVVAEKDALLKENRELSEMIRALEEELEQSKAEKAVQIVELRRTKDLSEKTVETLVAEKDALLLKENRELSEMIRTLEEELEQSKAEKAHQLGRTKEGKDCLAKRVKTLEVEKEALMEKLREFRERVSPKTATNVQQRIWISEIEKRCKQLKVSMEWNPETEKDELQ